MIRPLFYCNIIGFLFVLMAENQFGGYTDEEVADGTTFTFVYYDENGGAHVLYDGYCYENKTLTKVREIIGKYSLD